VSDDATEAARLLRSWDANADAWSEAVRGGAIESRRVATDAAILGAIRGQAPRRLLDVGCGEGWLCRAFSEDPVTCVGVDGSAALIARAAQAGGGTFIALTYEALAEAPDALGEGDFDLIVCNFALLGEDLVPLLRSLGRLLASGGTLLIQTVHPWSARGDGPYRDGWRTERFDGFGGAFAEPMPWYFRTLSSWLELLRDGGYDLRTLAEPSHPATGEPLSLLLHAAPSEP
jgi:SAM-dependent methyltransferase